MHAHAAFLALYCAHVSMFAGLDQTLPVVTVVFYSSVFFVTVVCVICLPRHDTVRRKMGVDATARGSSNGSSNGSSSSATDKSERGSGSHKSKEPQEPQPKVARKKEKGPKAMYEHVGRMNVRPFMDDDDPCAAQASLVLPSRLNLSPLPLRCYRCRYCCSCRYW